MTARRKRVPPVEQIRAALILAVVALVLWLVTNPAKRTGAWSVHRVALMVCAVCIGVAIGGWGLRWRMRNR